MAPIARRTSALAGAAAAQLLSRVASRLHSPRLSNLATRVKLDAFERVKAKLTVVLRHRQHEEVLLMVSL